MIHFWKAENICDDLTCEFVKWDIFLFPPTKGEYWVCLALVRLACARLSGQNIKFSQGAMSCDYTYVPYWGLGQRLNFLAWKHKNQVFSGMVLGLPGSSKCRGLSSRPLGPVRVVQSQ